MSEKEEVSGGGVTVRLSGHALDVVLEEQARLQRLARKVYSVSEVVSMMIIECKTEREGER